MICRNAWREGKAPPETLKLKLNFESKLSFPGCMLSTEQQSLPGCVGWVAGLKTSLVSALWKMQQSRHFYWYTSSLIKPLNLSSSLSYACIWKVTSKKRGKASLLPLPSLLSLKSLVSDCTERITSFNNDVNPSITWATNLGSLREKLDILEKFTTF